MRKMYDIKDLDLDLIFMANYNSHEGNTGDIIAKSYRFYADAIAQWDIAEDHKKNMFAELHSRYTLMLANEVMIGGGHESIGIILRNKEHKQGICGTRARNLHGGLG